MTDVTHKVTLPNGDAIVLLEWEGQPKTFCNLQRRTRKGDVVWTATPAQTLDGVWLTVRIEDGRLLATSYSGYLDEIDYDTGRVLRRTFVK